MQSGKIASVIRSIAYSGLNSLTSSKREKESSNSDYREPEREPSQEETEQAVLILSEDESLKNNGLVAKYACIEGKHEIEILDTLGRRLKTLKRGEIFAIILSGKLKNNSSARGRILDRSI